MNGKNKRLSQFFKKIQGERHSKEFGSFLVFRDWACSNGYEEAAILMRFDPDKAYSRENCYWGDPGKAMVDDYLYIAAKWDRFIDKIRQGMNLPPIMTANPCMGCPDARKCDEGDSVCGTRLRYWDKTMNDIKNGNGEES